MRRFEPPLQRRAVFYKFGQAVCGAAVSELGIFGTFLGRGAGAVPRLDDASEAARPVAPDVDGDAALPSEDEAMNGGYSGYLLRTKGAEVDEGGVATGFAVLNALYLVPDGDFSAAFEHRS